MSAPRVDHVTYQVPRGWVGFTEWERFFGLLGMEEVKPDKAIEGEWEVRWFKHLGDDFAVHLVETEARCYPQGLAHFCVVGVGAMRFYSAKRSDWCERDSGSGRIWLNGPCGIRVEVRP